LLNEYERSIVERNREAVYGNPREAFFAQEANGTMIRQPVHINTNGGIEGDYKVQRNI